MRSRIWLRVTEARVRVTEARVCVSEARVRVTEARVRVTGARVHVNCGIYVPHGLPYMPPPGEGHQGSIPSEICCTACTDTATIIRGKLQPQSVWPYSSSGSPAVYTGSSSQQRCQCNSRISAGTSVSAMSLSFRH